MAEGGGEVGGRTAIGGVRSRQVRERGEERKERGLIPKTLTYVYVLWFMSVSSAEIVEPHFRRRVL